MAEEAESRTLETTPTWAVAIVCFVLIATSLLIEHGLNLLGKYFNKRRRKALIQALEKIKSDLLLLGFISLLLTISEKRIATICIPKNVGETFLPCQSMTSDADEESKCEEQDKLSLLSRSGVQQLQLLIFVVAFFHVCSSFLTFSLGMAKMKKWESWEEETRTLEYQYSNDPRRFQLVHQTSFGRRHLKFWSEHRYLRLPACFLRQFYKSVSKVDYFTLRHGFITAHLAEGSNFDFQKYLRRALEKDFGVVVGISFWIWIFSVIFIFLNAHVFYNYFWLPFIPLVMLLVVGTKLQGIITRMCLDTSDKSHVVRGTLLVRPSDHFFWFGQPKLLLHLMHFILFQNSFQLAFFTWTWFKFGLRSCFHRKTEDIVIKLVMGLVVHILCGYVTLPLYALVTQMGTSMRETVFTDGVADGLKRWRGKAKKNVAVRHTYPARPSLDASVTSLDTNSARPSVDASFSTSLDTSPSFNNLNAASFSIPLDHRSGDAGLVTVEVGDEDSVARQRREQHQKLGSFEGFNLSKTQ
ncbi:MLO-like protein 12 isoform X2 [Actinidia eriantha]|uniref:MLO-like protein 12 isoform X2 n=1 Tax=Actinidia eriantha TaxID=165200 RepID=UPI0025834D8F|nr:MLO-like protein 12 isoform X2 [Actinidia eriantha]